MPKRFVPAEGRTLQAFRFALDLTDQQRMVVARQFGGRRVAYNWTVAQIKADLEAFHHTGAVTPPPTLYGMRKRWNQAKHEHCRNKETGEVWWPEVSKEAFASGVHDAVDAYWRWQKSRKGEIGGRPVGFPRFQKKGRTPDRYTITTGARLVDRRHVHLPMLGHVRLAENARSLERLLVSDRGKVLAMTVRRHGNRIHVALRVEVARPQQPKVHETPSRVGVDVGVRTLATVATPAGEVVMRVPNPKALDQHLGELRRLSRQKSRRTPGSSRYRETSHKISVLQARIANIRHHHIHVLTSTLAKTHSEIVVEDLDVAGLMRQKGAFGARTRRRGLSDAAVGEIRRQLRYKCGWYGSTLVEADRFYPSSKTCHVCGHIQTLGWAEDWQCEQCGVTHNRDVNAAINLARWTGDLAAVGGPVKQGADRKTTSPVAGGEDLRKFSNQQVGEQLRDGVRVA